MKIPKLLVFVLLTACGSTSSDGAGGAGAGGSGGSGGMDAGAAGSGGGAGAIAPTPPDPGMLRCGSGSCTVPGEVCCFESVSPGGADHCALSADCKAPNRACDENADCPSGQLCCTGLSVLPQGAVVGGFAGTFCVDPASPGSCLPKPGVGNSSVQACKASSECTDGECVLESCYGYPLMTCGGSGDCS